MSPTRPSSAPNSSEFHAHAGAAAWSRARVGAEPEGLELNEQAAAGAQDARELGDDRRHLTGCGVDDGVASDDGVKVLVGVWQGSQVADGEGQTRVRGAG